MGACPVVEMSGCFSQVITSLVKCFFTVMTENFGKILRWRKSGSVENPGFFVPSRYVGKNKGQKAQKSEMVFKLSLRSASHWGKRFFSMTKILVQSCSPSSVVL